MRCLLESRVERVCALWWRILGAILKPLWTDRRVSGWRAQRQLTIDGEGYDHVSSTSVLANICFH